MVVTTPAPGAPPISSSCFALCPFAAVRLLPTAFCFVLIVCDQQPNLLSERVLVEQQFNPLARRQLALLVLLLDLLRPAAETQLRFQLAKFNSQLSQARCLRR
jgi:hypothetical protein